MFPSGNAHHVIQHIRKDGLIGQQGILQEGDEILEVSRHSFTAGFLGTISCAGEWNYNGGVGAQQGSRCAEGHCE